MGFRGSLLLLQILAVATFHSWALLATLSSVYAHERVFGSGLWVHCRLCSEPAMQFLLSLPDAMELSHFLLQLSHLPHKVKHRVFLLPPHSWQLAALSVDKVVAKTVQYKNSPTTIFSVR